MKNRFTTSFSPKARNTSASGAMVKATALTALALCSQAAYAQTVSLSDLYQQALDNNPVLKSAALEIDSAKFGSDVVKGSYLPQVDAGLMYGGLRNDWTTLTETDSHGAQASVTVGQNIYNAELNAASDLVEQRVELTNVAHQVALESLAFQVAFGYFDALKKQEALKQTRATQAAFEEQLKQTEKQFSLGLIPENDVIDTRAQADLISASAIIAENEVEKALDALYELTGKEFTSVLPLNTQSYSANIPQAGGSLTWQEKAQQFNPEMQIQQQLIELSKQQISLADAGHKPSLGLIAEYRYTFASESRTNGMGQDKGSFYALDDQATVFAGVAMNLPVYRGGSTSSAVQEAQVQYQQALELQEQTWRSVSRQVRGAEKDLRALISAQNAFEKSVVSAERSLQATQQGFEIGSRTIVDVLNGTRQLYSAKQDLTEAQIDFILVSLQLKFLSGELLPEDIHAINAGLKI
ncbi:TolC family outer membrane protein [uncultured Vibrio sp.]|uniref:TolC family outer membrane protein n=1 Tax=uncultured Vibrio sp. TaxID=114054 RepID=UPI000AE1C9AE|nr:TolC family outer membrane protein [uncultured Vibrio sp.]